MDESHIHFLDLFLTHCLFSQSPEITNNEYLEIKANQHDAVMQGRDPELRLTNNGESIGLRQWGSELLTKMNSLAQSMDEAAGNHQYTTTLAKQQAKLDDDALTPSAQYLTRMKTEDLEFSQLTLKLAEQRAAEFKQPLDDALNREMQLQAQQSLMQQGEIEAGDQIDFSRFLKQYLSR
jgi:glutamate--cysteine ligase